MSVEWQSRPSWNVGRDHVFLRLKPLITEELAQLREAWGISRLFRQSHAVPNCIGAKNSHGLFVVGLEG